MHARYDLCFGAGEATHSARLLSSHFLSAPNYESLLEVALFFIPGPLMRYFDITAFKMSETIGVETVSKQTENCNTYKCNKTTKSILKGISLIAETFSTLNITENRTLFCFKLF